MAMITLPANPKLPPSVERVASASLPTEFGHFRILGFRSSTTAEEYIALIKGQPQPDVPALTRIHSQCLTGDVFHSLRCDCGRQLRATLRLLAEEGCGVVVYQLQEGRGIGIVNKIRAYELQDLGQDTVEANLSLGFDADCRAYDECAAILLAVGLGKLRLITNNPDKLRAVRKAGLEVVERVALAVEPHAAFADYLRVKREKMGHLPDE